MNKIPVRSGDQITTCINVFLIFRNTKWFGNISFFSWKKTLKCYLQLKKPDILNLVSNDSEQK